MRNALQEQLLKAGLASKGKVDQVVREKAKQRQGKAPAAPDSARQEAERRRQEQVERDRALAAERKAAAEIRERLAQARQIIDQNRIALRGDEPYRFVDGGVIRSLFVDAATRSQLSRGSCVIVRDGSEAFAVVPRAAADKIASRDAALIVVDHARGEPDTAQGRSDPDDEHYSRFKVPDDLVW